MLGSGTLLAVAAMLLAVLLPVSSAWRAVSIAVCASLGGAEIRRLAAAYRDFGAYRVAADGSVTALGREGREVSGRLLPGSLVLARFGWLRIATLQGSAWAELVVRDGQAVGEWRRLRVVCRHLSAC